MAEITRKTKRYPYDLPDEEWEQIRPLMPKPRQRGRPREVYRSGFSGGSNF